VFWLVGLCWRWSRRDARAPPPVANGNATPPAAITSPSKTAPGSSPASPSAAAGAPAAVDHVVIIVEENKPSQAIIGNKDAP
jgi:hypothetical protein